MATATKLTPNANLVERLRAARETTDELFRVVRPEALYDRPIAERHRIVFYIGHLEAFDWNLFRRERRRLEAFHPDFDRLFAFGIDPVDGKLPTDRPQDWPSINDVSLYNRRIRVELDSFLNSAILDASQQSAQAPLSVLLHTAIEHRLMHAETLAYMFHRLPFDRKIRQQQLHMPAGDASAGMMDVPEGTATLGLRGKSGHSFGWDNEFEPHQVHVPSFRIDKYMVTNGEYLGFVRDAGYHKPQLWAQADWDWICQQRIEQPALWIKEGNGWLYRGMFEAIALPLDWPVYVSQAEAKAYARWTGKALPTEQQWHRAAYGQLDGTERECPWGPSEDFRGKGNFDFVRWDPAPVSSAANNVSGCGSVGMLGNGWEWTSSEFAPFPGFEPFPFYPGYSANFFDGRHFVMKGGSSRTAAPLLRPSFRNWFQAHYQYVYAGFRCVSNGS
jgi:iron(II)-dependent oxidoreductase